MFRIGMLITALMVAFLLACGGMPGAQEEDREPPAAPPHRHVDKEGDRGFPDELKPSAEQKKQLKKIHFRYEEKRQDIILKLQNKKSELALMLNEDTPDRKKIDKKLKEVMGLEHRLQVLMLDEFFEIRTVLKPGQRKFFTRRLVRVILK